MRSQQIAEGRQKQRLYNPESRETLAKVTRCRLQKLKPWENQKIKKANLMAWMVADVIESNMDISPSNFGEHFGYVNISARTIENIKTRINKGWSPSADRDWLESFRNSHRSKTDDLSSIELQIVRDSN